MLASSREFVVLLFTVHAAAVGWCGMQHSPNFDEAAHLVSGLAKWHLKRRDVYSHNPLLSSSVAAFPVYLSQHTVDWSMLERHPLTRPELRLGSDFVTSSQDGWPRLFARARWACVPFTILGAWCCWLWASSLYGPRAALTSVAIWCASPTVLAAAHTITPDVAAAAFGLASAYTFSRWLTSRTWRGATVAGVLLGLAALTKFTWLVLFGLYPALWVLRTWKFAGWIAWGRLRAEGMQLSLIIILAVWLVNLAYGFEQSMKPLGRYAFYSHALSGHTYARNTTGEGTNRFIDSWIGSLPVPMPADYVKGLDLQKREFELGYRSYLRGEWSYQGWWYYYLYASLVKLPLGTLTLIAATLAWRLCTPLSRHKVIEEMSLLGPAIVVFVLVSSQTTINSYFRYVLPALPFGFIWISQLAEHGVRRVRYLTTICIAWIAFSAFSVFPHFGSFFNAIGGGPENGAQHLIDSNIGWGQDLVFLKEWLEENPLVDPIGLAYYGSIDPRDVGIQFYEPAKGPSQFGVCLRPSAIKGPLPGWYAIDVSFVCGLKKMIPTGDGNWSNEWGDGCDFTYFANFQPIAKAGYSIYIYHITLEQANDVRKKLGIAPLPVGA